MVCNEAGCKKNPICELIDFAFNKDIEELNIEYPCLNFSFN